jgi:rhomboid family GlyGly-CTERM serine protease
VTDARLQWARADRRKALWRWRVPLGIALLCVVLSLGGDTLRELARYERNELLEGEIWRLVSGHLVHLGTGHTILNLSALGILVWLFDEVLDNVDWAFVMLASALGIDVGLYWFASEVDWYVGLSGVLHGVMIAGSLKLLAARAPIGLLLLVLTLGKLAWEQWGGPVPFSELTSGGPVVIEAHLFGALGGVAGLALSMLVRRARRPPL